MGIRDLIFKAVMNRAPRVRGLTQKYYFSHPFLDAWFVWFPLGYVKYGGAEIGEIFNTASRINERDPMSWGKEWTAEGARVEALAEDLLERGHKVSARMAFLRAFTYYRTGHVVYGPGETQSEMTRTFDSLRSCFRQFADLAETPIEPVRIPFEQNARPSERTMRGFFYSVADDGEKRPTVIFLNGAETMSEDAYFWTARAGTGRGYNVLTADIPGDMVTRIDDPDLVLDDPGDAGLRALVDYALSRPDVDAEKLAVIGISMGGYKAGRLAQIDDRIKAVVANAPMMNAGKVLTAMKKMPRLGKGARDYATRFCWQYGIEPGGDLTRNVTKLVDEIWASFEVDPTKITCPFMSLYGANELGDEAIRQVHEFDRLLGSTTKVKRATTRLEGAESHCQLNNYGLQHQVSYDFLDEVIWGRKPTTLQGDNERATNANL